MKTQTVIVGANKLVSALAAFSLIAAAASCSRREPKIDTSAPSAGGTKPAPTVPGGGGDGGRYTSGGGGGGTTSRPTSGGPSTGTTGVAPRNNTTGINPGPGTTGVTPPAPRNNTTGVNPGPGTTGVTPPAPRNNTTGVNPGTSTTGAAPRSTSGVNPNPGSTTGSVAPRSDNQVTFTAKVVLSADGPRVKADLPSGASAVGLSYQKVDGTASSTTAVVDITFKLGTKTCSAAGQSISTAGTQVTALCN